MPSYHYERLSVQDMSFLIFEQPQTHMHVGGMAIYDAGPLTRPGGGIDIDRIRDYIASRLSWIPRYRQRVVFTPLGSAVWIDDDKFNLSYHVRHTGLPKPGDDRQLKQLAARILSQQLDRGKPLWESWIVEGLQGGRFAMLTKAHHCMIDGASGVDLSTVLMRTTPEASIDKPEEWLPRCAPTATELLRDELLLRAKSPLVVSAGLKRVLRNPTGAIHSASEVTGAIWDLLRTGLKGAAPSPLNQPIGPHRRFDWFVQDLNEIKLVKNRLGGTVNDVVLTTVAGGLRRFLQRRRVRIEDLDYKAVVPVNMRSAAERGLMGNRVSAWFMTLPLREANPLRRLGLVREATSALKESKQALAAETLTQLIEATGSTLLLSLAVKITGGVNPYNLIVTNVPGPNFPLYLLGAEMQEAYPQVPLFENQGLGIALFSYLGRMCWGFNADWDLVPDIADLVADLRAEFRELLRVAQSRAEEIIPDRARTDGGGRKWRKRIAAVAEAGKAGP